MAKLKVSPAEDKPKPLIRIDKRDRHLYDWRCEWEEDEISDEIVLDIPFTVAENYLREKLGPLFDRQV